jgi:hypothetical protein
MRTLSLQDPSALTRFPPRARGLDLYNERALPVDALDALPRALEHLRLSTLAAPDLAPIAHRFPALRSLAVAMQGMARDPLTALSGLPALREVELWLSDEGVPALAPLAHLHALTLVRALDGSGLARELGALPALRELTLYARESDAAVLASVAALPALEHLKLRFVEPRHPDALCALAGAPALRSLELSNIHALSAAEVAALVAIPTLTSLSLELRASSDVAPLQPLREAGRRLLVTIPRGATPQDALLVELARVLPDVVALDLRDAPVHGFSSVGLAALRGLTHLEWLDLGELPSAVKHDALTWLSNPPALAHLAIGGKSLGAKLVDTLRDCAALRTLHLKSRDPGFWLRVALNSRGINRHDEPPPPAPPRPHECLALPKTFGRGKETRGSCALPAPSPRYRAPSPPRSGGKGSQLDSDLAGSTASRGGTACETSSVSRATSAVPDASIKPLPPLRGGEGAR